MHHFPLDPWLVGGGGGGAVWGDTLGRITNLGGTIDIEEPKASIAVNPIHMGVQQIRPNVI